MNATVLVRFLPFPTVAAVQSVSESVIWSILLVGILIRSRSQQYTGHLIEPNRSVTNKDHMSVLLFSLSFRQISYTLRWMQLDEPDCHIVYRFDSSCCLFCSFDKAGNMNVTVLHDATNTTVNTSDYKFNQLVQLIVFGFGCLLGMLRKK